MYYSIYAFLENMSKKNVFVCVPANINDKIAAACSIKKKFRKSCRREFGMLYGANHITNSNGSQLLMETNVLTKI